ncbi:hypothetical protein J6590_020893 [Homalodisca vitripennis]|nr:hypothetical protein J6590_020893 [Homalodisca vitripennis]
MVQKGTFYESEGQNGLQEELEVIRFKPPYRVKLERTTGLTSQQKGSYIQDTCSDPFIALRPQVTMAISVSIYHTSTCKSELKKNKEVD